MTREEREDAIKYLKMCIDDRKNSCHGENAFSVRVFGMAIEALRQEPKTGRWIWCGGAYKCSNCNKYTCFEDNTRNAPKYCPNCGAKMGSEASE